MTATAQQTEAPVGRKTVTFYSKGVNTRLVRRAHVIVENALGHQQELQKPLRYEFAPDGFLTVYEGQDVLPDGPLNPETLQPSEQDALSWLRAHPNLNVFFWEEGAEPDRPQPIERDFLVSVATATAEQDADTLRDLLVQERATHGRQVLIDAAQAALTALGEPAETPLPSQGAQGDTFEGLSRDDLEREAQDRGLVVPAEATDDQVRAALLLAGPPQG